MRWMGIAALGPKPRTSKPAPRAQDLPLSISQPGHRAAQSRLGGGHHLCPDRAGDSSTGGHHRLGQPRGSGVAAFEHHGRGVLPCGAGGRVARFGKPEIFNTDQGSQFTSGEFTGMLAAAGIRISMDGRDRWIDNVFIERLWRSLKYEDVYLKGYADGREARAGIAEWLAFYNHWRPHQALANRAPMAVWRARAGRAVWIGRCAWTTLARCPHPHSRRNSKPLSLDDFRRSERSRCQLRNRRPWSHGRGPL